MIDDSEAGAWARALLPDHRDVRFMTLEELRGPFIYENVQRWHGLATLGEARDMVGKELNRRAGK